MVRASSSQSNVLDLTTVSSLNKTLKMLLAAFLLGVQHKGDAGEKK